MVCLTCFGMAGQYYQNVKTDSHLSIWIGLSPAVRGLSQAVTGKPSEVLVNILTVSRRRGFMTLFRRRRANELDAECPQR